MFPLTERNYQGTVRAHSSTMESWFGSGSPNVTMKATIPVNHFLKSFEHIPDVITRCRVQYGRRTKGHSLWMWCAAGLLFVLAGCSSLSLYRYADWIILWQADHYLDLTSDQRHDLSERLTSLLARHRREAIPQYEDFLVQIQQRFERGLTSQDIGWVFTNYDRLRNDLVNLVIADSGIVLASVNSSQVHTLEVAFQKDTIKATKLVHAPMPERLKKRADDTIDWIEDWLGSLSQAQETQIRELNLTFPDTQPSWATYRQQQQLALLALLRQPHTSESLAHDLRALLAFYPDPTAPHAYQKVTRQMRDVVTPMVLAVDQQITPRQRRHAVAKLQQLIDQLHDLQTD